MKKMLALVVILGAIAAVSVSFLAQAEPQAAAVTTEITTTVETPTQPTAAADKLAMDTAECTASASVAKTDGMMPTDAEKSASIKECLEVKGHKQESADTIVAPAVAPDSN